MSLSDEIAEWEAKHKKCINPKCHACISKSLNFCIYCGTDQRGIRPLIPQNPLIVSRKGFLFCPKCKKRRKSRYVHKPITRYDELTTYTCVSFCWKCGTRLS
jgi:hypothetical protein